MAKNTFLSFDTTASNNTDIAGIDIQGTAAVQNFDNAFRQLMAILRTDLDNGQVFVTKAAGYTAVANDNNAFYEFTATATLALTAAATLAADWHMMVFANGGAVTINPDGAELINGSATLVVANGDAAYIICTGTAFKAITIPSAASIATKTNVIQAYADVASNSSIDLGAAPSQNVRITGTTTITSLGTAAAGIWADVLFAGALTMTHNGTSLILQNGGSNIVTAAGDTMRFVSLGSGNWRQTDWQKATPLKGIVQEVSSFTGAVATGTTVIPSDDTIPQITEGDQYLTVTITPTNAANILEFDAQVIAANGTGAAIVVALFQTGTANALTALQYGGLGAGVPSQGTIKWKMVAGSTSALTFTIRAGPTVATTLTFNGAAGGRKFGGVMNSFLVVREVSP